MPPCLCGSNDLTMKTTKAQARHSISQLLTFKFLLFGRQLSASFQLALPRPSRYHFHGKPMNTLRHLAVLLVAAVLALSPSSATAAEADVQKQIDELRKQNETLQQQLRRQQEMIEKLNGRLSDVQAQSAKSDSSPNPESSAKGFSFGKVQLSGEAGMGIFHTGSKGQFPNAEFRIDEAKLWLEAPVWEDVYFFAELDLTTREGR